MRLCVRIKSRVLNFELESISMCLVTFLTTSKDPLDHTCAQTIFRWNFYCNILTYVHKRQGTLSTRYIEMVLIFIGVTVFCIIVVCQFEWQTQDPQLRHFPLLSYRFYC